MCLEAQQQEQQWEQREHFVQPSSDSSVPLREPPALARARLIESVEPQEFDPTSLAGAPVGTHRAIALQEPELAEMDVANFAGDTVVAEALSTAVLLVEETV